jgi:hypothetical protein
MSGIVRMWRAAKPHKRQRWRMAREIEATAAYEVIERNGNWYVLDTGKPVAGPSSNGAAWKWIDWHTVRRRYN